MEKLSSRPNPFDVVSGIIDSINGVREEISALKAAISKAIATNESRNFVPEKQLEMDFDPVPEEEESVYVDPDGEWVSAVDAAKILQVNRNFSAQREAKEQEFTLLRIAPGSKEAGAAGTEKDFGTNRIF